MEEHNEEEENQKPIENTSEDSMEVDISENTKDDVDSELIDSDVNVEATELTSSDAESEHSEVKNHLSSDLDSNPNSVETPVESSNPEQTSDQMETSKLESKDGEEETIDDEDKGEGREKILPDEPNTVENNAHNVNLEDKQVDEPCVSDENEIRDKSPDTHESTDNPDRVVEKTNPTEQCTANNEPNLAQADTSTAIQANPTSGEEINEPDEKPRVDESSDFIGFDPNVTNETMQIYHILQENHQELAKKLRNDIKDIHEEMEVDSHIESESVSPNKNITEETSQEKTEEQVANSKRIKKKRKFFDEFDDTEMEPAKRPHLMKERENTSNVDNSSSENKENLITEKAKEDTFTETGTSSMLASSTPNPPRTESKTKFDITNPDFKEPFKYGWKREVVYRFISEDGRKRSADVSYFTPQGKKLRSIKQIHDNLPSDGSLHVKNFTFSKELIFRNRESELEVTRFTKKMEEELNKTNQSETSDSILEKRLGIDTSASDVSKTKKKEIQKLKKNSDILKSKSKKKDEEETTNATPKLAMPKIMLRGPNNSNSAAAKPATMKIKITSKSTKKSKSKSEKAKQKRDKEQIASPDSSPSKSTKSSRGMPACTISCPLALGTMPTLQCTICLCLYHFQCCGLDADETVYGFECKNCRIRERENVQNYKTVQRSNTPKPYAEYDSLADCARTISKNTKIVDGVTTWLPSSSNIRLKNCSALNTSPCVEVQSPLVQGVLELNGKRYVVVPKQSVLSVTPNPDATFDRTVCEKNTASVSLRDGVANTLLVNPSDVNSAGVVLVPVPSTSPRHIPSRFLYVNNRVKFSAQASCGVNCSMNGVGSPNEAMHSSYAVEYQSSFTLSNLSRLYDPLLMSLKYLTVRDLLRVSMSCKLLNRISTDSYLWKTVRLRNSQVHDWDGFAKALQKYGTRRLDMRKMLCSSNQEDIAKMWNNFLQVIPNITNLEHIDFGRTPTNVVNSVAATCDNLSVINALYLKNGTLQLENFTKLKHLAELRLKSVPPGMQLERNEQRLQFVNKDNLKEICLTSVRNIDMDMLNMICEAENLISLELGECDKLPSTFASGTISKLTNLKRLRLEKLEDLAPKYDVLNVIKDMSNLNSLELINIEVKEGFNEALALCNNLKHFLLIPTYLSQSATTNRLILNGIKKLSPTMKSFVWGLTVELLKVTDLFMNRYNQTGGDADAVKKAIGESIPILKSVEKVPSDGENVPAHVDILPVAKLEKMLTTLLPNSRVKVIKIPYQSTWRQCLSECLK